MLREVVVTPFYHKSVGNLKSKKSITIRTSGVLHAYEIKNKNKISGLIKSITIKVKKQKEPSELILHLYKNENATPGEEINLKDNKFTILKNEKEVSLNILRSSVEMPPKGIFIGLEIDGSKTPVTLKCSKIYRKTFKKMAGGKWVNYKNLLNSGYKDLNVGIAICIKVVTHEK